MFHIFLLQTQSAQQKTFGVYLKNQTVLITWRIFHIQFLKF